MLNVLLNCIMLAREHKQKILIISEISFLIFAADFVSGSKNFHRLHFQINHLNCALMMTVPHERNFIGHE